MLDPLIGFPDLANQNLGLAVKHEFQINNEFLSLNMSQILHEIYLY